ncbi:MAG: class I adenylate-forming enzyme family protein [Candidatus Omnitrophota bacterium]|nr:acyl--CoA ligase [Candidatus Omnitrophota bacterium]
MNIKELLIKQTNACPDKTAIIFNDREISFMRVKDDSFKLANYFLSFGIKKEDKVAVFLSNSPETVISFLGTFSIGACLVPLDFMLTEEEIVHFINHSQAKVLVTQIKKGVSLSGIRSKCDSLEKIIVCYENGEGGCYWQDILENNSGAVPNVAIDEECSSSIFYTSGSTGHPKGVRLTYKNFDAPINCITHHLSLSNDDMLLCGGLPFSHLGGLDYILLMLYFAQTLVLMSKFHPLEFLKNIEKHKITLFWTVPPMYIVVLSLKGYDKVDLSSLKYAVVFGAPSSPILLRRFHQLCPNAHLINGWGMTETSAPNCFLPPGIEKIDSVGKFSPGMTAKIVDDEGNTRGVNQEGELWVRGEGVMKEYYNAPELTAEVLTSDGWLKTGDVARFDDEGLCYIVGRKKDMIKVAGEVVFSSEVEEKIMRYPQVTEAAVIGVFDKLRGEVPKAFIVAKEEIDVGQLKDFLKEKLTHFKIPHHFEFVIELPKNRVGKIDKQRLKQIQATSNKSQVSGF